MVSIPQAVSTIAMMAASLRLLLLLVCFNTASGKYYCNRKFLEWFLHIHKVSIPQAVSTIAILKAEVEWDAEQTCFNTASGKYYCNFNVAIGCNTGYSTVSIPQAVSTIAMSTIRKAIIMLPSLVMFQYRKR